MSAAPVKSLAGHKKKEVRNMPGNTVQINNSPGLTWYVGDSKMPELMAYLHKIGKQLPPDSATKEK